MSLPRLIPSLLVLCGLAIAGASGAVRYLDPASIKITAIISGPPAPGSAANDADIRQVLSLQQSRTATQVARARSEETLRLTTFDPVLGSSFTSVHYPRTFALLNSAASDAEAVSASAKALWHRPRPSLQDAAIHPAIPVPPSDSYPSGHAMRATLWGDILAKLAPGQEAGLLARADVICLDREIAGVHFPTDVWAGHKLGHALAARLLADPAFEAALADAAKEFPGANRH